MKVTIPVGLLALVAVLAYMLGTESGRQQRDVIMVKLGRGEAAGETGPGDDMPVDDTIAG